MILGANEHLDRTNPEECSSHIAYNNLFDRLFNALYYLPIPLQPAEAMLLGNSTSP